MNIPFFSFKNIHGPIKPEIDNFLKAAIEKGWFIMGSELTAFQQDFADYLGCKYCVGVANGLDALHLSMKALDIGPGDEVIVPSNTYIATWLAASYAGATIIPVEPNDRTFNLDPSKVESAISNKTKAIVPVHLFGQPCEMDPIMDIAKRNDLFIIEDNAQSQGSEYKGKRTGTFGDANGVSFYPAKNLGALGDAGAVTTNNQNVAEKIALLGNYGSSVKYYNDVIGYNSRLDELQAGILRIKLRSLDEQNQMRRAIANKYSISLAHIEQIKTPLIHKDVVPVYHQYVIQTDKRDALQKHLNDSGVGTLIHYPVPPHLQKAYKSLNFKEGDFPIAEKLAKESLSLPIYPGLTDVEIEYICDSISVFFKSL